MSIRGRREALLVSRTPTVLLALAGYCLHSLACTSLHVLALACACLRLPACTCLHLHENWLGDSLSPTSCFTQLTLATVRARSA